jgi:type IV pilus assembly protein PilC
MPSFSYKAINQKGATVSGVIEADSIESANKMLGAQGFIPSKVQETKKNGEGSQLGGLMARFAAVKAEEIILMTKQFKTMLAAGLSVVQLFEILQHQTQNKKLKDMLATIAIDIREGRSLTEAFRKHEKILSPLYVNMIHAGEISGTLPEVLDRLVYILDHEHQVKSDIKAALQYPKMVVGALGIAFVVLLTFVIPKFVTIFQKAGLTLPLPTKICLILYHALANYWYIFIIVIVGLVFAYRYYMKTLQGRLLRDRLILKTPIVGPLYQKAAMARFASIFSILQTSGIPVLSSLEILSGTIGNEAISREFDRIRDRVEEGRGISSPLRSARYFSPMVIDMVSVGEETGALDEMLHQVSMHYDDEVAYQIKQLSDMIGPILIVGLAAVVGFFAMAIFLPMWDLTQMAH